MILPKFKQNGFTLMEIIVVLAMVGILSGILLVVLSPSRYSNQSKDATSRANLFKLAQQIETYRTAEGTYPTDTNGNSNYLDDGLGQYVNIWPNNNPQGSIYQYIYDADSFAVKVDLFGKTGCYAYCSNTGTIVEFSSGACLSIDADCNVVAGGPTPTPTITPTPSGSPTISPTVSPTTSATPTISPTVSVTPTVTTSPTISITPTLSPTPTASPTISPSSSPTCDNDTVCEVGESCSTCGDCTFCGVSPNPVCPSDTPVLLSQYNGILWTTGSPPLQPSVNHQFNVSSNTRISVIGYTQEGHPEMGCPSASNPQCGQNQTGENVSLNLDGIQLGIHNDLGANVHDWFLLGPFYRNITSGNHTLNTALTPPTIGNSAEYRVAVCSEIPLTSTCINDTCNGGDTAWNCTSDCGPRTSPRGQCGDGGPDVYESCYDCSVDVGVCAVSYPSFRTCPAGYVQLATFWDWVNPDTYSSVTSREMWYTTRTISLPRTADLLLLTRTKEGHPELGCPNPSICSPAGDQAQESYRLLVNGTEIGRHTDRGLTVHAWNDEPNWSRSAVPSGNVTFRYEHILGNVPGVNESVDFMTTVCGR